MSQWVRKRFSSEGNVFCSMPAWGVIYGPALQVGQAILPEPRLARLGLAASHQSEAGSASAGSFLQTVGSLTRLPAWLPLSPVSAPYVSPRLTQLLPLGSRRFFRLAQRFHPPGFRPASSRLTSGELASVLTPSKASCFSLPCLLGELIGPGSQGEPRRASLCQEAFGRGSKVLSFLL